MSAIGCDCDVRSISMKFPTTITISQWSWYWIVLAPVCHGHMRHPTRAYWHQNQPTCQLTFVSLGNSFPRHTLSLAFTKVRVIVRPVFSVHDPRSAAVWFTFPARRHRCDHGALVVPVAPLGLFILPWYKWTHYVLTNIGAPSFSDPRNNHWDQHSRNVAQEFQACCPRCFSWHN